MRHETRFRVIEQENPQRFHDLATLAKAELERRVRVYQELAHLHLTSAAAPRAGGNAASASGPTAHTGGDGAPGRG
jgi:hypothetical protein